MWACSRVTPMVHVTNFGSELPLLFKLHKFGQLILMKIIETVATRCQILWLKCTKFDFGWRCALEPAGGALIYT